MASLLHSLLIAAAYVAGWSALPMFDRLAITAGVPLAALPATTLPIAAIVTNTYLLIFTDGAGDALRASTSCAYVLAGGATLGAVMLVYVRMLSEGGMMTVVLVEPVLLIAQTTVAAAVLKEPFDRWKAAGVAVAAVSIMIANGAAITERLRALMSRK